jgi:hypothetical protein
MGDKAQRIIAKSKGRDVIPAFTEPKAEIGGN